MSSVQIIKQKGLSVYLMEINESQLHNYRSGLTDGEKKRLKTIRHPAKRSEFLASRFLRTELFGLHEIRYSPTGSPYIEQEGFISLSHTHGLVGIARSLSFNVGLDLERIREKAVLLSSRFIHDSERLVFDTGSAFDMSLLWSFKETLFKLGDRRGVHFATDLIVRKTEAGYTGSIRQDGALHQYDLAVNTFQDYLVTCNTTDATLIY